MKYLLLIYQNVDAWQALPEADRLGAMNEAGAIVQELETSGEWVSGEALADVSQTKTVKVRNGLADVTDGPFAESREHLAGFVIVECETEQRAVEIAARWPDARYFAMEVRPLMTGTGEEM